MRSSPRGTLVLGMPPSVGLVLTVPLVESFRAQYPLMSMRVIEGFSGHVLEWLLTSKIDVAILYNAPRMSNLRAEPLLQDELFLLGSRERHDAPPQGPVAAAVLAQVPLIMPSRPHGLQLLVDSTLSQAGITPRVELEVDAMPSTLSLVERGMGYTIHSYSTVYHLVTGGRIDSWQIVEPVLTRKLILATSSQRPTTAAMRALVDLVRAQIRNLVRRGIWIPRRQLARAA
jgi:LysR family transcriptional regulator, nitrogen assimilation regulatory protein